MFMYEKNLKIINFSVKKFIFSIILSSIFTFIFTFFSTNLYTMISDFHNSEIPKSSYIYFDFGFANQKMMIFHYKDFYENQYNFKFDKAGTMILSNLENTNVIFSKVTINGQIYRNKNTGRAPLKITYDFAPNENIKISIETKKITKNIEKEDCINKCALIILLIFYFIIFFYFFNIENFIIKFKNLLIKNKISIILFFILALIYFLLCKNFYINTDYFKTYMVGSDVPWVIEDIYSPTIRRFHPYFFIGLYPFLEMILYFISDKLLALGILYSFIAAATCTFIYKTLILILKRYKFIALLLTLLYAFSFCQLIFTAFFETYIVTSFYLAIITFLIVKESLFNKSSKLNLILITFFTALAFGVSMSNIVPVSILIATSQYIKHKNKKKIILIFLFIIVFIIGFLSYKYLTAENLIVSSIFNKEEINNYLYKIPLAESINNFNKTSLSEIIIAPKIFIGNMFGLCADTFVTINLVKHSIIQNIFKNLFLGCFFVLWAFAYIYIIKFSKLKDKSVFYSISCSLLVNFIFVIIWKPEDGFLFALSHLLFWYIIIAFSIYKLLCLSYKDTVLNKRIYIIIITIIVLFLIFEIINNYSSLNLIYEQSYKIIDKGLYYGF